MAEKPHPKEQHKQPGNNTVLIAAIVIVVIAIWAEALLLSGASSSSPTFSSFKSAFQSSSNVIVYSIFNNSTSYVSTYGCASVLLQKLEESPAIHKNVSDISFYIVNSTNCTGIQSGLATSSPVVVNESARECLALSAKYPSIFLNYSTEGNGTTISGHELHFYGNQQFLSNCGIAFYFS